MGKPSEYQRQAIRDAKSDMNGYIIKIEIINNKNEIFQYEDITKDMN